MKSSIPDNIAVRQPNRFFKLPGYFKYDKDGKARIHNNYSDKCVKDIIASKKRADKLVRLAALKEERGFFYVRCPVTGALLKFDLNIARSVYAKERNKVNIIMPKLINSVYGKSNELL